MYACAYFQKMPRSEKKILFSDSLLGIHLRDEEVKEINFITFDDVLKNWAVFDCNRIVGLFNGQLHPVFGHVTH